jgi:phosphoglucomutase
MQEELAAMADSPEVLEDAFWRDLSFGTGGLRGTMGAGTNRMNIHTVAHATQGLANYLNATYEAPKVAIAHDSRHMGVEFSHVAAEVFAANGIHVYLYPRLEPTPALSFAVRYLGCSAGVCVTASHNPREYNGYKVYGADGCQITTEAAKDIQAAINAVDVFSDVKSINFDQGLEHGLISWIDDGCLNAFLDAVAAQSLDLAPAQSMKVVYTPLNGTGLELVTRILERIGNIDITLVPEQKDPDGDFPTCPYPNPEIKEALQKGLDLCEDVKPDILLATDPDADRCGIAVRHNGEYRLLTGNEVGILLTDYVARAKQAAGDDLTESIVVSTVVSSDMVDALASEYGFQVRRTLTGFKFIGEQIGLLEKAGEANRFMLGFEESYGYLRGSYVRDKDAVVASMLICQMARYHKSFGRDLVEVLENLYQKFGYYRSRLISVAFPGESGVRDMQTLMGTLRKTSPIEIAGLKVLNVKDYSLGLAMPAVNSSGDELQTLPKSNVLEFDLEGGSKLIVRPSGTEPKCKAYLSVRGETASEADSLMERLDNAAHRILVPKGGE